MDRDSIEPLLCQNISRQTRAEASIAGRKSLQLAPEAAPSHLGIDLVVTLPSQPARPGPGKTAASCEIENARVSLPPVFAQIPRAVAPVGDPVLPTALARNGAC